MPLPPFVLTQQWHFNSVVFWASSRNISNCGVPHPIPSGCLCTVNNRPLPGSALQTPCSSTQPLSMPADTCLRLVYTRAVAWTICVGLTLFGPTQAGFCTLLWALKALFLSRLISPPVKMFFGYRNVSSPLATLFHRGIGPFLLPLFFLLSLSSHLVTRGSFLIFLGV